METLKIKYKVPEQFLIGERDLLIPVDFTEKKEEYLTKLLQQPFSLKVFFPFWVRFQKIVSIEGNDVNVEYGLSTREDKIWKFQMYYMIEGKLSRTKTGLDTLILINLERSDIWQIIESQLFKEYIYSEMGDRLPPDANKHCIKLKELSLEYGELLFSIQLL